eukprot:scaffold90171_cov57-Phaeocystis_antarctica.AAC.5
MARHVPSGYPITKAVRVVVVLKHVKPISFICASARYASACAGPSSLYQMSDCRMNGPPGELVTSGVKLQKPLYGQNRYRPAC